MGGAIGSAVPGPGLLRGASVVETAPYRAVQRMGREVLGIAGILLVEGPPGTGKTCAAADLGRSVPGTAWLHLAATTRGNEVLRGVLLALGEDASGPGTLLLDRARRALARTRLLIVVDEAHLLNRDALRQIRYLYDQPDARFGLVLVGNDFARSWEMAPELESRLSRVVRFGRLGGEDLDDALRAHHPVLAATGREVLDLIDLERCAGNWRTWETVLVAALGSGATEERGITMALARSIIAAVPPTPGLRRGRGAA